MLKDLSNCVVNNNVTWKKGQIREHEGGMRSRLLKIPCLCMAVIPTPTISSMTSFSSHWMSHRLNFELGNGCKGAMSQPIVGAQTTELL